MSRLASIWLIALTLMPAFPARAEYRAPSLPSVPELGAAAEAAEEAPRPAVRRYAASPASTLEIAEKERALEELRSKQMLEEQLIRVRRMLGTLPPAEEPDAGSGVSPDSAAAFADEGSPTERGPERRLISSLDRYRGRGESRSRRPARAAKLSNAAGGTELQASLEFNRSARGTRFTASAPKVSRPLDKDGTLGFSAELPVRRRAPVSRFEEGLTRHRPVYQDNGIRDGAQTGGRHRSGYTPSGIDAFGGGPASTPSAN